MTHDVCLTRKAYRELKGAAKWWAKHRSPAQAERWTVGFLRTIQSLAVNPERQPFARENGTLPFQLRELRFGLGRKPTHREVFVIRPNGVFVYGVRHLAQRDLTLDDL